MTHLEMAELLQKIRNTLHATRLRVDELEAAVRISASAEEIGKIIKELTAYDDQNQQR